MRRRVLKGEQEEGKGERELSRCLNSIPSIPFTPFTQGQGRHIHGSLSDWRKSRAC